MAAYVDQRQSDSRLLDASRRKASCLSGDSVATKDRKPWRYDRLQSFLCSSAQPPRTPAAHLEPALHQRSRGERRRNRQQTTAGEGRRNGQENGRRLGMSAVDRPSLARNLLPFRERIEERSAGNLFEFFHCCPFGFMAAVALVDVELLAGRGAPTDRGDRPGKIQFRYWVGECVLVDVARTAPIPCVWSGPTWASRMMAEMCLDPEIRFRTEPSPPENILRLLQVEFKNPQQCPKQLLDILPRPARSEQKLPQRPHTEKKKNLFLSNRPSPLHLLPFFSRTANSRAGGRVRAAPRAEHFARRNGLSTQRLRQRGEPGRFSCACRTTAP